MTLTPFFRTDSPPASHYFRDRAVFCSMRLFVSLLFVAVLALAGSVCAGDDFWRGVAELANLADNDERVMHFRTTGELAPDVGKQAGQSGAREAGPRFQPAAPSIATSGFSHPGSVLAAEPFESSSAHLEGPGSSLRIPESFALSGEAHAPPRLSLEDRQSILSRVATHVGRLSKVLELGTFRPYQGTDEKLPWALIEETFSNTRARFRKAEPGIYVIPEKYNPARPYITVGEGGSRMLMQRPALWQLFVWRTFEKEGSPGTYFQYIGVIDRSATPSSPARKLPGFNIGRVIMDRGQDWVYVPYKVAPQ